MNKNFLIGGVAVLLLLTAYSFFGRDNGEALPALKGGGGVNEDSLSQDSNRSAEVGTRKSVQRATGRKSQIFEDFKVQPFQQDKAELNNTPSDPLNASEFEAQAEDSKYTELDTVRSLEELLMTYRANVGGDYDTGSNIEITNALLGDNPRKIALLSANSSRINKDGELVDSYGTPYDFHFISTKRLIIRSAGEDLELYTDDDITSAREDELSNGIRIPGQEGFTVDP